MGQTDFAYTDSAAAPRPGANRQLLDVRPLAIQQWLSELPLANPEECARRVSEKLNTACTVGMSAPTRLQMLRLFENTLAYLLPELRKLYVQQPFPLPTRSRNAAKLNARLCEEMVRGYRLVLLTARRGLFGLRRRQRAQATLGICRYSGYALLNAWLLYEQPPAGAWRLLHETRTDAAQAGFHNLPMPSPVAEDQDKLRIDGIYKKLLLTDAAGPWHLPRGEVLEVFRMLGDYADYATLVSTQNSKASLALFMVNTNEDRGVSTMIAANALGAGSPLVLLTQGLLPEFNTMLAKAQEKNQEKNQARNQARNQTRNQADADQPHPGRRETDRIQRLMTYLEKTPKRQHNRQPANTRASLVVGLNAIHRLLSQRNSPAVREAPATQAPATRTKSQEKTGYQAWFQAPRAAKLELMDKDDLIGEPFTMESISQAINLQEENAVEPEPAWSIVNSSNAGYCMTTESSQSARVQVGELVLISEYHDTQKPVSQMGIIRWLKANESDEIQVGIQLIAPCPGPVHIRLKQASGDLGDPAKCLLLPARPRQDQPATLITPALSDYTKGCQVYFMGKKGGTSELLLTNQFDGTGLFRQFIFQRTDQGQTEMDADRTTRHSGNPSISQDSE